MTVSGLSATSSDESSPAGTGSVAISLDDGDVPCLSEIRWPEEGDVEVGPGTVIALPGQRIRFRHILLKVIDGVFAELRPLPGMKGFITLDNLTIINIDQFRSVQEPYIPGSRIESGIPLVIARDIHLELGPYVMSLSFYRETDDVIPDDSVASEDSVSDLHDLAYRKTDPVLHGGDSIENVMPPVLGFVGLPLAMRQVRSNGFRIKLIIDQKESAVVNHFHDDQSVKIGPKLAIRVPAGQVREEFLLITKESGRRVLRLLKGWGCSLKTLTDREPLDFDALRKLNRVHLVGALCTIPFPLGSTATVNVGDRTALRIEPIA